VGWGNSGFGEGAEGGSRGGVCGEWGEWVESDGQHTEGLERAGGGEGSRAGLKQLEGGAWEGPGGRWG